MPYEEWALVKPTLGATEYVAVRILRRGRRFTHVQGPAGAEWLFSCGGLWVVFTSSAAAVALIDALRAASTAHVLRMRDRDN